MAWLRRLWTAWLHRRGDALDATMRREIQFHLEMAARDLEQAGRAPGPARHEARRRFGSPQVILEQCRDAAGVGLLQDLGQDVRLGARLLVRDRRSTAVAAFTLMVAIGVSAAVWSVYDAVLVRPLPYADGARLVTVWQTTRAADHNQTSAGIWRDWTRLSTSVVPLAAFSKWNFTLTGLGEADRLDGALVTAAFFETLGVPAALGRTLRAGDADHGTVVVVSDRLWRARLGARPLEAVLPFSLNGTRVTVVGVMPRSFAFPDPTTDVWVALSLSPEALSDRTGGWLRTIGRLAPGATIATAQAEFDTIARNLARANPPADRETGARVQAVRDALVGDLGSRIVILFVGVLCLGGLALMNVSSLAVARTLRREPEIATRTALGAETRRLIRQFVVEGMLVALVALVGAGLAGPAVLALGLSVAPAGLPFVGDIRFDESAMAFLAGAFGVAVAVCGGVPSLVCLALGRRALSTSARGHGAQRLGQRWHGPLTAAQIAIALALGTVAVLLSASYLRLAADQPGFDPRQLLTFRIALPRSSYTSVPEQTAFFDDVVSRVRRLPGVQAAGAVSDLPIVGNNVSFPIAVRGQEPERGDRRLAGVRIVTADYFEATRIRLVRGRRLASTDDAASSPVAVINETFARVRLSGNPIGQFIQVAGDPRWLAVVGVVNDVRQVNLGLDEGPSVYLTLAQKPFAFMNWMSIVARSADPTGLAAPVRAAVNAVDPSQPVFDVQTMGNRLAASLAMPRLVASLLSMLALMALVLCIVGVFGALAVAVATQGREIGLRLALGATRAQIRLWMLRRLGMLLAVGGAGGTLGAYLLARLAAPQLYGVSPHDARVFAGVAVLVAAATLIGAWGPTDRAARIDPMVTMK